MAAESTFTMNLDATGVEGVNAGSDALQRLAVQIKEDRAELAAMQTALRNLSGSTNVAGETIQALKDKIAIHKIVIADAQAAYVNLGGTFANESRRVADSANRVVQAVDPIKVQLEGFAKAASFDVLNADLRTLESGLVADHLAASRLKETLSRLGPQTEVNAQLIQRYELELAKVNARIGAASVQFDKLGGSFENVSTGIKQANGPVRPLASALSELAGSAALLPGPLATGVSRLSALAALMKAGVVVAGGLAIGAAFVAMAAGVVGATVALFEWQLRASNARREHELSLQAIIATNKQIKGQQDTWRSLGSVIDATAFRLKTSRERVNEFADRLYAGGLRGRFLQTALTAVTTAALAGGDAVASKAEKEALAIGNAGAAMDRFGLKVERNLGSLARARALSFGEQVGRLRQNLAGLVDGVNLDKLAERFSRVVDLFDRGTATGQGLRALLGDMFQGFVDDAVDGTSGLERFIKRLVLGGLELRVEYYKIRNGIRDTFKGTIFDTGLLQNVSLFKIALFGVGAGIAFLGVAFGTLAVLAATPILAIMGVVYAVDLAVTTVKAGFDFVGSKVKSVGTELASISWASIGSDLVDGLIGGIRSGATRAVETVRSLGRSMLSAFKSDNEIRSPSARWSREAGEPIPQGVGGGVRRATRDAENATGSLSEAIAAAFQRAGGGALDVAFPTGPARGPATPTTGGALLGRGRSLSIGAIHIEVKQLPPNVDAKALASQVFEMFVEKIEESSAMSGAYG
jgi:hypothetical protein